MNEKSSKYLAHIDGLRAIAVLVVLFYHADLGCRGGYVGVDIFFVISGYLITGLILKDLDGGRFRILEFWERRVRRIFPALIAVIIPCLIAGWFLFLPRDFSKLGQSVSAQVTMVSNIYFWKKSNYFEQTDLKPLLHTWSLAVEEQFYLLLPLLLITFNKYVPRKIINPAILLLCSISFGLSVYCSYFSPSANFYLLHTRAWELLTGAFLATITSQRSVPRWVTESLSWLGLLAIIWAVFFYDSQTRFPGVSALLPCVGTALVIWANRQTVTSSGKLLALSPVVFIGLISYSLYLWHWPVLIFYKYWALNPLQPVQGILLLAGSMVLAVLSWRFVETPFRKRKILKSQPQIFKFAGITTAVLLLAGLTIYKLHGVPSRIPADALQYANGKSDRAFLDHLAIKQVKEGSLIECGAGNKQLPIDLLVWGDSHAMAVMPILDILCKAHSIRGVAATHSSIPPLVGYNVTGKYAPDESSLAFNDAVGEFLHNNHIGNVILVGCWDAYIDSDGTDILRDRLLDTIRKIQATGARIWIMRQVPKQRWNVPDVLTSAIMHGHNPEELGLPLSEHLKEFQRQNPVFEGLAERYPDVTILDPTDFFVSSNRCRVAKNGKSLYSDDHHLSIAGCMILRPMFEPIFCRIERNQFQTRTD